jgi:hypothetical protein
MIVMMRIIVTMMMRDEPHQQPLRMAMTATTSSSEMQPVATMQRVLSRTKEARPVVRTGKISYNLLVNRIVRIKLLTDFYFQTMVSPTKLRGDGRSTISVERLAGFHC